MSEIVKAGIVASGLGDHLPGVQLPHKKAAESLKAYGITSVYQPLSWRTTDSIEGLTTPLRRRVKDVAHDTGLPVVLFLTSAAGVAGGVMALEDPDGLPELERLVLISSRVNPHGTSVENPIQPQIFKKTVVHFHRLSVATPDGIRDRFVPVRPKNGDDKVSEQASNLPGTETIFYPKDAPAGHHSGISLILGDSAWLAHVGIYGKPPESI